jgi:hypothetical protein
MCFEFNGGWYCSRTAWATIIYSQRFLALMLIVVYFYITEIARLMQQIWVNSTNGGLG